MEWNADDSIGSGDGTRDRLTIVIVLLRVFFERGMRMEDVSKEDL